MIKFIVIDDSKEEIAHIKRLLGEVVEENMEVLGFTKITRALKDEIQNTSERKIYILDIDLGNRVSGISVAKMIRDIDYESEIIFITNHDKMFESAHRAVYEVFDFIEKFHEFDQRFKKDIRVILKRNFDNKMFKYNANNIDLNIYYRSILYIYRETEERKLVIVTLTNTYKVGIPIKEMLTYLDSRFVQCHRSCIVNKDYVTEKNFKDGYFVLTNGKKVYMLVKKYREAFND